MLDTLDLRVLTEWGDHYRQQTRKLRRRTVLILALAAVILFGLRFAVTPTLPGALYTFREGSWETVATPFRDLPADVQIADDGAVWVLMAYTGRLYRYDGAQWQSFAATDYDLPGEKIQRFTLRGNDLWAATQWSAIHFDGAAWTAYASVLSYGDVIGLAAGDFGVIVIHSRERITQFRENAWSTADLYTILPKFDSTLPPNSYSASLRQAPDGTVWLAYHGLWRFDGENWSAVPFSLSNSAELIGADADSVWLSDDDAVTRFYPADESRENFYFQSDLGLTVRPYWMGYDPIRMIIQADRVWLATTEGIATYAGRTWQRLDTQPAWLYGVIGGLALAANGTLWLATGDYNSFSDSTIFEYDLQRYFTIWGWLLPLLPLVWWFYRRPITRNNALRARRVTARLPEILPDLFRAMPAEPSSGGKSFFILLVVLFILLLRGMASPVGVSLIIIGWLAAPVVWRLLRRPLDAASRAYWLRRAAQAGLFFVLLVVLMGLSQLALNALLGDQSVYGSLLLTLLFTLFGVIVFLYISQLWLLAHILRPLGRGDYTEARQRVTILRQLSPHYFPWIGAHTIVLLLQGCPKEAEDTAREYLLAVQRRGPRLAAAGLVNLAAALDNQQRYDESLPLLEEAARMLPEQPIAYRGLIIHYQMQQIHPLRALELSEVMIHFERPAPPRWNYFLQRHDWLTTQGTRALALAQVGDQEQAEALLAELFRQADPKFQPGMAELQRLSEQIRQLPAAPHRPEHQ